MPAGSMDMPLGMPRLKGAPSPCSRPTGRRSHGARLFISIGCATCCRYEGNCDCTKRTSAPESGSGCRKLQTLPLMQPRGCWKYSQSFCLISGCSNGHVAPFTHPRGVKKKSHGRLAGPPRGECIDEGRGERERERSPPASPDLRTGDWDRGSMSQTSRRSTFPTLLENFGGCRTEKPGRPCDTTQVGGHRGFRPRTKKGSAGSTSRNPRLGPPVTVRCQSTVMLRDWARLLNELLLSHLVLLNLNLKALPASQV